MTPGGRVADERALENSYYMKPGEKRRAKQALSRKRLRKKQRRELD